MVTFRRRNLYITCLFCILIFGILYIQIPLKGAQYTLLHTDSAIDLEDLDWNITSQTNSENTDNHYLVNSSNCRIPSIYPFTSEILPFYEPKPYVPCRHLELLTYISKEGTVPILYVNQRAIASYKQQEVICCYKNITRREDENNPDNYIDVSNCQPFQHSLIMPSESVYVACRGTTGLSKIVYENVHTAVRVKKNLAQRMNKFKEKNRKHHLSVLFVGIDSISRLNFKRSLPHTNRFLTENNWLEFAGYNKIGDNTFPNLMAVLSGMNETEAFALCDPYHKTMDNCPILFDQFRKHGFITAYAEDETEIGTFNYLKKGFRAAPTDYYWRPYTKATEQLLPVKTLDSVGYCTGPENAGERIMNIAYDFATTFKHNPYFGFFWMNSFSHNSINSVSRLDNQTRTFFQSLYNANVMDNAVVIFLSDHGFRFGEVTYTHTGWLEDRLPFFFLHMPKWFQKRHADKFENLVTNTRRLTTPYDLYMTLQDILGREDDGAYAIQPSRGCPQCRSLFDEVDAERSCLKAGIEYHWCTCRGYLMIEPHSRLAEKAALFVLAEIRNNIIEYGGDFERCNPLELKRIISAGISDPSHTISNQIVLITFESEPSAVFQGTVKIERDAVATLKFVLQGSISRLDIYAPHSWCADNSSLKKYCYCKQSLGYYYNLMRNVFAGK